MIGGYAVCNLQVCNASPFHCIVTNGDGRACAGWCGESTKAVSLATARVIYHIASQPFHVLARVGSAAGGVFPSLHIQDLAVLSFPSLLII